MLQLTEIWSTFASGFRYESLPSETVETAKWILLDTIGVAFAATTLGDCSSQLLNMVRSDPGKAECTLLGYGQRASIFLAALCNGSLAHALNYDALDTYGGHIGLAAVPSPLLVAERYGGITGRDLLAAVAVAAEFTCRLGRAVLASEQNRRFLDGQLLGYFGATVGACRACRCSAEVISNALGLALMQAAGSRQVSSEGGAAKSIYGGFANYGAIMGTMLAQQGVEARCAALEGRFGLYEMFYGGLYDPSILVGELGERFLLGSDPLFKRWPVSSVVQPFVEASIALRRTHSVMPNEIRLVRLRVPQRIIPWIEPLDKRRRPENAATAGNSIVFAVAKVLVNGSLCLGDFSASGLAQTRVHALADRVAYSVEEHGETGGFVEITLTSGEILSQAVQRRSCGLTFDELRTKFKECVEHAAAPIMPGKLDQVIEAVTNLEKEENVMAFLALVHGHREAR